MHNTVWLVNLKLIHCKSDMVAGITCFRAYERVNIILLIESL